MQRDYIIKIYHYTFETKEQYKQWTESGKPVLKKAKTVLCDSNYFFELSRD